MPQIALNSKISFYFNIVGGNKKQIVYKINAKKKPGMWFIANDINDRGACNSDHDIGRKNLKFAKRLPE